MDTIDVIGRPDNGINWGDNGNGGRDKDNSSSKPDLSKTPEAQQAAVFGAPVSVNVINGAWGFTLYPTVTVDTAIQSALSKIEQGVLTALPFAGRVLGVAFGALIPSPIGKDDPSMMSSSYVVNTLPASKVTAVPLSVLPTQKATVVHTRVADVVTVDDVQHVAIIRDKKMTTTAPVVAAKATQRKDVYAVSIVPGKPDLQIKLDSSKPSYQQQDKKINKEQGNVSFPGFTEGIRTHEVVVHFPGNKAEPIYISMTEIISKKEVIKQKEEELNKQLEWDYQHPIEVAEREYQNAINELDLENKNINSLQNDLNALRKTKEALVFDDAKKNPITVNEIKYVPVNGRSIKVTYSEVIDSPLNLEQLINHGASYYVNVVLGIGEVTAPTTEGLAVGNAVKQGFIELYDQLRKSILKRQVEIKNKQIDLNLAIEQRNLKDNKVKEAKDKRDKENQRNQPGIATGDGGKNDEEWFSHAADESPVPIPKEITDKLRGRKFNSFDEFRKALWLEISKSDKYSSELLGANKKHVEKGRAPYVGKNEQVGGRKTIELHHVKPISQGGGVYDIDNIVFTTPKRHIEIHKGKK